MMLITMQAWCPSIKHGTIKMILVSCLRKQKAVSSIREIPLDDDYITFIDHLPPTEDGRLLPSLSNNAVNKTLRKIVGREVRVHSLRHTYASYLIAHDIDLISVSQVLGHENLNITLEVYAHQLQEQKSRNDEKIKQIWGRFGAE